MWCDAVWCGVVWCGVAWWCGMVWCYVATRLTPTVGVHPEIAVGDGCVVSNRFNCHVAAAADDSRRPPAQSTEREVVGGAGDVYRNVPGHTATALT